MENDVVQFGTVIMTPKLNHWQFGDTIKVQHNLKARRGKFFIAVCLGIMEEPELKSEGLQKELEERMNALGWYKKKPKKSAKR